MSFEYTKDDEFNFWKHVTKTYLQDGTEYCWLWKGNINTVGYGEFYNTSNTRFAHRFSFQYHGKSIPDKYVINHKCNIRCCVNPNHLNVMTQKQNCKIKNTIQSLNDPDYIENSNPLTPIQECIRCLESEFSWIAYTKSNGNFVISDILLEIIKIRMNPQYHFDYLSKPEELIDGYKRKYFWLLDDILQDHGFNYKDIQFHYKSDGVLIEPSK